MLGASQFALLSYLCSDPQTCQSDLAELDWCKNLVMAARSVFWLAAVLNAQPLRAINDLTSFPDDYGFPPEDPFLQDQRGFPEETEFPQRATRFPQDRGLPQEENGFLQDQLGYPTREARSPQDQRAYSGTKFPEAEVGYGDEGEESTSPEPEGLPKALGSLDDSISQVKDLSDQWKKNYGVIIATVGTVLAVMIAIRKFCCPYRGIYHTKDNKMAIGDDHEVGVNETFAVLQPVEVSSIGSRPAQTRYHWSEATLTKIIDTDEDMESRGCCSSLWPKRCLHWICPECFPNTWTRFELKYSPFTLEPPQPQQHVRVFEGPLVVGGTPSELQGLVEVRGYVDTQAKLPAAVDEETHGCSCGIGREKPQGVKKLNVATAQSPFASLPSISRSRQSDNFSMPQDPFVAQMGRQAREAGVVRQIGWP